MLSLETRERLWGSSPWSVLAGKALWHQCAGRRPRAQRALRSLGVPGKSSRCWQHHQPCPHGPPCCSWGDFLGYTGLHAG